LQISKKLGKDAGFMSSSIEAYSSSGWQPINAPLPEGVSYSCAVTLNATAVMLIGGQSDSQVYCFSQFYHYTTFSFYQLITLLLCYNFFFYDICL
jgi:hypothetical protein